MIRTGKPGRLVSVGWMLRFRRVISADLIDAVLRAVAPGDDDAITVPAVLRGGQFSADAQQRRQCRAGKDTIPMPVHIVFQTGIAGRVGAGGCRA